MSDDDLRARIARVDPLLRADADPTMSPSAHEIRERVMQTIEDDTITTERPAPSRWRRPALVAAAAASIAGVALGAALLGGGDSGAGKTADEPTTLALTTPVSDPNSPTMNSCLMFDVNVLKGMPVAFGGTVTEVGDGSVSLDVDKWYKGGDADVVTIATPGGNTSAALDGVEFTEGSRYLVTATEGTVNGCGFSGPATAELESSFDQAFGG